MDALEHPKQSIRFSYSELPCPTRLPASYPHLASGRGRSSTLRVVPTPNETH